MQLKPKAVKMQNLTLAKKSLLTLSKDPRSNREDASPGKKEHTLKKGSTKMNARPFSAAT